MPERAHELIEERECHSHLRLALPHRSFPESAVPEGQLGQLLRSQQLLEYHETCLPRPSSSCLARGFRAGRK